MPIVSVNPEADPPQPRAPVRPSQGEQDGETAEEKSQEHKKHVKGRWGRGGSKRGEVKHLSSFLIKLSPPDLAVCFLVADCHEALLILITPFITTRQALTRGVHHAPAQESLGTQIHPC